MRIEKVAGEPRFVAPRAVEAGAVLRVVNRTDPARVGPHTFSLVVPAALPRGPGALRACFAPGRICRAIADWHGAKGNGPPARNLAEAGAPGWDAIGGVGRRGDSWFSGYRRGASVEQPLSLPVGETARTVHFICAIDPTMHGSIEVVPNESP